MLFPSLWRNEVCDNNAIVEPLSDEIKLLTLSKLDIAGEGEIWAVIFWCQNFFKTLVHPQTNLLTPLCYSVQRGFQSVGLVFGTWGHTVVKCDDKVFVGRGATCLILCKWFTWKITMCPVYLPVLLWSMVNWAVTVGGRNMSRSVLVTNCIASWNEDKRQRPEESLPSMPTPCYFNTSVVWRQDFLVTCGGRINDKTDCVELLNLRGRQVPHCP